MYQYDQYDRTLVSERVKQFRDQVRRFLAGELSDEEFRPLRLMNGLYLQRHAPMLRVAIPYGLLSSKQLRMLAHISRRFDKDFGHFSTRQNVQFNWPRLEDVPDILEHLASVDMHAIQTSGNCVRNITCDHLAGVAVDELEDPRPYCELLRQWSTLHPEFSYLPRKFKIAVSGARTDRAAVKVHDIGLYLVRNDAGEVGFRVLVGGGQGRTPCIGAFIREFLDKRHLFSYLESILRVYNRLGRRDNKHKARIKIIVNAMGIERFTELVEEDWRYTKSPELELPEAALTRMQEFFRASEYRPDDNRERDEADIARNRRSEPAFTRWMERNVEAHKAPGYAVVYVPLKAPGAPPGDATSAQMEAVAELADCYSRGEIRVTHDQNLVLAHVHRAQLYELWKRLEAHALATPNLGLLTDMICCPGLDFCSLANAGSIPIAKQLNEYFDDLDYLHDIGELRIKMSGCMNACGHHHVGHIGILGVDKRGKEFYQLTLGGDAGNNAALGDRLGPAVAKEEVAATIDRILKLYLELREDGERFIDTYRRIGMPPFKERAYASH